MTMTSTVPSFQDVILRLHGFWARQGCVILQPYDVEMGAGTFHPATTLRALGPRPWRAAYVQPSRRPTDGRYGENPHRLAADSQQPGHHEAQPGRRAGPAAGQLPRHRDRPAGPRHPLRRGRLGEPDPGRLGPGLG